MRRSEYFGTYMDLYEQVKGMFWCDSRGRGGWTRAIKKDEDTLCSVLLQLCFLSVCCNKPPCSPVILFSGQVFEALEKRSPQIWTGVGGPKRKHQSPEETPEAGAPQHCILIRPANKQQNPQMCTTQSSPQLQLHPHPQNTQDKNTNSEAHAHKSADVYKHTWFWSTGMPPRTEKTVWMEKTPADWSETFLRYTRRGCRVYLDPGSGQILVQYEHRVQSQKVFWLQAINYQ